MRGSLTVIPRGVDPKRGQADLGSLPFPGRILRRTWCLRVAQTLISKRKSHQNRLDRPPWPTFRARKIFSPGAFGVGFAVYVGAMGRFGVGPGSKNADYVIWVQTESRVRVSMRTRTYARVPGMREGWEEGGRRHNSPQSRTLTVPLALRHRLAHI